MIKIDKDKLIRIVFKAIIRVSCTALYWGLIYALVELFQIYIIGERYLVERITFWKLCPTCFFVSILYMILDKYDNGNKIFTKQGLQLLLSFTVILFVYIGYATYEHLHK